MIVCVLRTVYLFSNNDIVISPLHVGSAQFIRRCMHAPVFQSSDKRTGVMVGLPWSVLGGTPVHSLEQL